MSKNGFRIFDTDTHVGPNVETLELYAGPGLKARWGELEQYYQKVTEGHHLSISPAPFKRSRRSRSTSSPVRASVSSANPDPGRRP